MKRDPASVAEEIRDSIEHPLVKEVEVLGGYVNIYLDRRAVVERIFDEVISPDYGSSEGRNHYVIDYSSPNIAKPMHVGHLRSTIIGESLKRILTFRGHKVTGINYLGDIGTQFGIVIAAYKLWKDKYSFEDPIKDLLDMYVRYNQLMEEDPYFENVARSELEKLEAGDPENIEIWKKVKELSLKGFDRVYKRLGVTFDVITGESEFVEPAKRLSMELINKGIAFIPEEGPKKGAVVADLEKEGLDHPVLLKSDGTTMYLSRDLASLKWRYETFKPTHYLYVVAIEQSLHFKQLFSLANKIGIEGEKKHISFGMVHVEGMRLSTRKGQVVFLEDVLNTAVSYVSEEMEKRGTYNPEDAERIGVSSVIFWMLKIENNKDITMRWKDVTSFTGESGPYVQYAYVRSKHVLERFEGSYKTGTSSDDEWTLIKDLLLFPEILNEVERSLEPHRLARHLLKLSSDFHHFYEHNRIIGSEKESFRAWITKGVNNVLRQGQYLLGMKPPEVM